MRKIAIILIILAVYPAFNIASAQETEYSAGFFMKGNDLVELMRESEKSDAEEPIYHKLGLYQGNVIGVWDSYSKQMRAEEGVTVGQLCAIVTKYLKENPKEWNDPGVDLVYRALIDAFPK